MEVTFNAYRREPGEAEYRRGVYKLDLPEDATIMDGMLKIRDEEDPNFAFRGSCLRGYCGDCMMSINGKNTFACTAKVANFMNRPEIALRPIRMVPVIKDLVFDWDAFMWNKIKVLNPWIEPQESTDGVRTVPDKVMADLRNAMSCYYCGLCDEGCTVLPVDMKFLGPAALTKAYRLAADPRDKNPGEHLKMAQQAEGIWDCVHCYEASEHCPRNIGPTERIVQLRDMAFEKGITNERVARHHTSFAASVKASGWLDEARLAIESEGLTNISGLMKLLPIAARAAIKGKAPIPYLHHKRPGAKRITEIFEKGDERGK
ncbi:MAG: hypothetical protein EXR58_08100 [Chloroflexi bacterium]|nr:hypothetical protein [Chloroflexota bacterium]